MNFTNNSLWGWGRGVCVKSLIKATLFLDGKLFTHIQHALYPNIRHAIYHFTHWCRFLFNVSLLSLCLGKYQLKAELHGRNVSLTWRDFKPPGYQFEYSVALSTSLTTTTMKWKKVEVRLF